MIRDHEGPAGQAKYTVDCFTPVSVPEDHGERIPTPKNPAIKVGLGSPENTYDCDSDAELHRCLSNCTREVAGIRMVRVWINRPDDREPVPSPKD